MRMSSSWCCEVRIKIQVVCEHARGHHSVLSTPCLRGVAESQRLRFDKWDFNREDLGCRDVSSTYCFFYQNEIQTWRLVMSWWILCAWDWDAPINHRRVISCTTCLPDHGVACVYQASVIFKWARKIELAVANCFQLRGLMVWWHKIVCDPDVSTQADSFLNAKWQHNTKTELANCKLLTNRKDLWHKCEK